MNFDIAGTIMESKEIHLTVDSGEKIDPDMVFKEEPKPNTRDNTMKTSQNLDPKNDLSSSRDYGVLKL